MAKKYVYFFGAGAAEGNMKMKEILGGKGANLAEMAGIGLPVPPGFTISTEVCALYYKNRERIPESVRLEVDKNLKKLEKTVGQAFGDPKNPLLVSVRSGARASMPELAARIRQSSAPVTPVAGSSGGGGATMDCRRRSTD